MSYQVQRNGKCIGVHDERTLLALLHAGALKATDTYCRPGRGRPEPLASLLGDRSWWRTGAGRLLITILAVGGISTAALLVPRPGSPQLKAIGGERTGTTEQILRGTPVIHATIAHSGQPVHPAFPVEKVTSRATACRVAVLALDADGAPLRCCSGFVTGNGTQVVTTLSAVSGASAVELRFANGRSTRATTVIFDREADLAVLGTEMISTPLDWSTASPVADEELFIAGHGLMPAPAVGLVQAVLPEEKRVYYRLGSGLPASTSGSAVLGTNGEVKAIVIRPEEGLLLRGAEIRRLLQDTAPRPVSTLASLPVADAVAPPVVVDSAAVEDGQLVIQLRNTGNAPVTKALLYIRYHELPAEAGETTSLERELATIATEAAMEVDEPDSDRGFLARQRLREVTARLEAVRRTAAEPLRASRQRVYRVDLLCVEADLPPGLPQRIAIEAEAGTRWGAMATVLDAAWE